MSVNAAMLKALREEGLDLDACIRVIEAGEKKADPTNAARQARHRARRARNAVTVTQNPPIEELHTPVSETKVSSTTAAFPKPEGVSPDAWRDFLTNRKTKRLPNTASAHKKLMDDLQRLSGDDWPQHRLIEHAAAKGWGGIYDPRPDAMPKQTPRQAYGSNPSYLDHMIEKKRQETEWAERKAASG